MINNPINRWWTVVGGALACAVSIGVIGNSFGIFTKAIVAEFGWDRSTATLGLTIQHIFSGLSYVPLGMILNRWDVRRPTALLVSACAVGIICLGLVPNSPTIYYALFAVVGVCGGAATAMPYSVAIIRWFDGNRGLALGLMVTGTGVGATLMPMYTNFLLTTYGWRIGFVGLGSAMLVGTLLALAFMVRSPPAQPPVTPAVEPERESSLLSIVTGLPRFWLIAAPIFFLSTAVSGILVNIVPIMTDRGYAAADAVGMLSTAGIASILSRAIIGAFLDRILAPFVAAGVLMVAIVGLLVVLLAPAWLPAAYLSAICIGLSLGAEADVITFMVSRYFRPAVYSKVVGAVFVLFAWGNGAGISVVSYAHDYLGSYQLAIELFVGVVLLSVVLVLQLGPYPYPWQPPRSAPARDPIDASAASATRPATGKAADGA